MAIDESLKTLLATQNSITSLLSASTAIAIDSTDQNIAMPYIAISKVGGDPLPYIASTSGMQRADIAIVSVATKRPTSTAINKAIFAYIKDYSGLAGSDTINAVQVVDDGANDEVEVGQGTESYRYLTTMSLSIFWTSA